MSENPWTLIKTGRYHRRPVIFGLLDAEGLIYYVYKYLKNTTRYFDIDTFVPYYYKKRSFAALEIDQDFFPTQNYSDIETWIEVWGYSSFIFDIIRCVEQHIKWSNVYFYKFSLDTDLNWSKIRSPDALGLKGACHGDELGYLFKKSTTPKIEPGSANDIAIERLVTLWTNFAIFGMPIITNDSLLDYQQWLPIRHDAFNVLNIGKNLTQGIYDPKKVDYWRNLYDTFSTKTL